MKLKSFRPGGVHLQDNKLSAKDKIINVELPRRVVVSVAQHQGKPALPIVKPGDVVSRFQLIAEAQGFISANIHAPISGMVKAVGPVSGAFGYDVEAITIEATEAEHEADMNRVSQRTLSDEMINMLSGSEIIEIAKLCGIVGLGGATFPTNVKLSVPENKVADFLVVNGAECEPFLTCDHRLMIENADEIIRGIELACKACGASEAIIGIEANKFDAIEQLQSILGSEARIRVVALKEKYPQGGEKQLVKALTRRTIPAGKLPIDAGAVVINVATCRALWRAVAYGEPLVDRVLTVTGPSVETCANYRVAIGTNISYILSLGNIEPEHGSKLVSGGPMMGRAIMNQDAAVEKGTSGLLVLPPSMALRAEVSPCIRCARCVSACPMGLEPYLLGRLGQLERIEEAVADGLLNCIECGCCSYICPSHRPLLDYIRFAKDLWRAKKVN